MPTPAATVLQHIADLYEELDRLPLACIQDVEDAMTERYGIKDWNQATPDDVRRIEAMQGMIVSYKNARRAS